MELEPKTVCGYEFVKLGTMYKAPRDIEAKFDKKPLIGYDLAIDFVDKLFLDAEQSVYLVYREDDLVYAGYYSKTFYDRWVRKQNDIYYVWHGIEDNKDLKGDMRNSPEKFTIWITKNPYSEKHNISKLIEDEIISKLKPCGNKVGRDLIVQKDKAIKVLDIVNEIQTR